MAREDKYMKQEGKRQVDRLKPGGDMRSNLAGEEAINRTVYKRKAKRKSGRSRGR